MKISEGFRRYLIETRQVVESRRYKWLSAIFVVLLFACILHVFEPEYWQMRRVRRHIENISPQWNAFKHAHPGFEAVEIFPRYDLADGVCLAAKGMVHWSVDLNQLAEFMRSTKQPFSIDVLQVSKDFSNASPAPGYKKMSVGTIEGRRIEIVVRTEPYHGSGDTSARSKAEPGRPANGSLPVVH